MLRTNVQREGIVAGILGASSVALWFFAADLIDGRPLHTPLLLASSALSIFGAQIGDAVVWPVLAYTVFHYAAFIGVGVAATNLLAASNRSPGHFAGLFLLFAVFEAGFYGLCVVLSMLDLFGVLAWYQIGAANALASLVMGTYLWRRHPEAVRALDASLRGVTP